MPRRRPTGLLTVFLLLGLLIPAVPPPVSVIGAAPAFASPLFEQVWARADQPVAQGRVARSWLWGPGPGETRQEAGADGTPRPVQYFDKARMEGNPSADPAGPWAVTTGLLTVELVRGQVQTGPDRWEPRPPALMPPAGDGVVPPALAAGVPLYGSFTGVASLPGGPDHRATDHTGAAVTGTLDHAGTVGSGPDGGVHYSRYAPETGHNVPDVFARFGQTRDLVDEGGRLQAGLLFDPLYVLGYPISEAYWTIVPVGGNPTRVLIQLYQRRVLTYIPSFPAAWQVQMGNVGAHYYAWRYGLAPAAPAPPPSATPPSSPAPPVAPNGDTFVRVAGDHLIYQGQPVVLKGTNYWLHTHPFVGTWTDWDGNLALADLEKARELGVNTIRIGIPYDHGSTADLVWGENCTGRSDTDKGCQQVNGWITDQMTQLLQIASVYGMKVIFALFDWSDTFPLPGDKGYQRQLNYLQGIVAPFADDDRVLAWDLHNEPENYATWGDGAGRARIIAWAGNTAQAIHGLDSRHPLTLGVGQASNLWLSAGGKTLLDAVDFVSFHCYDAGGLRTQMDAIRARTTKPILLEEMGWPSGPSAESSAEATYDEATQQFLYRAMLGDAKAAGLAGVVQWTLWDFPVGSTSGYKAASHEEWFGLVRLDGSFKPAADDFRAGYPAPLLPSRTATDRPLTSPRPGPRP